MNDEPQRVNESTPGPVREGLDPRYLAFFAVFNARQFYEAHDVLEAVWLPARATADAQFYQGLIQIAGAFVHLQKQRPAPAGRLLRRAQAKLAAYPDHHRNLDLAAVRRLIGHWLARVESAPLLGTGWGSEPPPRLPVPLVDRE